MTRTLALAVLALTASIAAMSLPTPASAQMSSDPAVQVVNFADLDLRKPQDVRKLDRRIGTAIANVCGPVSDADPAGKNTVRRCRAETAERVALVRDRVFASRTRSFSIAAR